MESRMAEAQIGPSFSPRSVFNPVTSSAPEREKLQLDPRVASVSDRLNELIRNYRVRAYIIAEVDPLGTPRPCPPELKLEYYSFTESELNLLTNCATLPYDAPLTIREIQQRLRNTYCRFIEVQFMHMGDAAERRWLQKRMESTQNRLELRPDEQKRILTCLTDGVIFEEFIRKKFVGAKTFSLKGCESLIPLRCSIALKNPGLAHRKALK